MIRNNNSKMDNDSNLGELIVKRQGICKKARMCCAWACLSSTFDILEHEENRNFIREKDVSASYIQTKWI